ncbi:MAG: hypothetical protein SNJ59_07240 [Aggregatilineales bacterium]
MSSSGWFRHALRRSGWQPQRQLAALLTLGLFVTMVIGGLYLSRSAATSTLGRQLEELIQERNNLEQANEQLRAEIASLQGIPRLLTRAAELGFIPASEAQIAYVVVRGYNPDRVTTVAPLAQDPEPLPVYDESFIGWVQQQLAAFTRQLEEMQGEVMSGAAAE